MVAIETSSSQPRVLLPRQVPASDLKRSKAAAAGGAAAGSAGAAAPASQLAMSMLSTIAMPPPFRSDRAEAARGSPDESAAARERLHPVPRSAAQTGPAGEGGQHQAAERIE